MHSTACSITSSPCCGLWRVVFVCTYRQVHSLRPFPGRKVNPGPLALTIDGSTDDVVSGQRPCSFFFARGGAASSRQRYAKRVGCRQLWLGRSCRVETGPGPGQARPETETGRPGDRHEPRSGASGPLMRECWRLSVTEGPRSGLGRGQGAGRRTWRLALPGQARQRLMSAPATGCLPNQACAVPGSPRLSQAVPGLFRACGCAVGHSVFWLCVPSLSLDLVRIRHGLGVPFSPFLSCFIFSGFVHT
jgi:hypothetical protein